MGKGRREANEIRSKCEYFGGLTKMWTSLSQIPCLCDSDTFGVSTNRGYALPMGQCKINVGRNEVRWKFCMNIKIAFLTSESNSTARQSAKRDANSPIT